MLVIPGRPDCLETQHGHPIWEPPTPTVSLLSWPQPRYSSQPQSVPQWLLQWTDDLGPTAQEGAHLALSWPASSGHGNRGHSLRLCSQLSTCRCVDAVNGSWSWPQNICMWLAPSNRQSGLEMDHTLAESSQACPWPKETAGENSHPCYSTYFTFQVPTLPPQDAGALQRREHSAWWPGGYGQEVATHRTN